MNVDGKIKPIHIQMPVAQRLNGDEVGVLG